MLCRHWHDQIMILLTDLEQRSGYVWENVVTAPIDSCITIDAYNF
jgi:hypothetical protein